MPDFEQLTAGESNARAFVRVPDGARAGVVVLHAWWGLNNDVLAYADRLAEAGYAVVAPDMFSGQVATEIEDAERLSREGDEGADVIAFAAVDRLAERLGPGAPLAVLGFSFGAAYAILAPSERDRLVASVVDPGIYRRLPRAVEGRVPRPLRRARHIQSEEDVKALEEGLREAGREFTIHRYPGVGHWFAEPSRDAYQAEAADLAFERTVAFLRKRLEPDRPAG